MRHLSGAENHAKRLRDLAPPSSYTGLPLVTRRAAIVHQDRVQFPVAHASLLSPRPAKRHYRTDWTP